MVLYTVLLWWLDSWEREPLGLILAGFFLGMGSVLVGLVAIHPIALRWATQYVLPEGMDSELFATSVVSPVLEEVIKAVGVTGLFLIFRYEWNSLLDGVIYGAIIGFGFAAVENTLYFHAIARAHPNALAAVILWRSVLFGFNHAMYASVFGWGLAYASCYGKHWLRAIVPLLSLGMACVMHMAHNWLSIQGESGTNQSLRMNAAGLLFMIGLGIYCWRRQSRLFDRMLHEEVDLGTIDRAFAEGVRQRGRMFSVLHWLGPTDATRGWRRSRQLVGEFVFAKESAMKRPSQENLERLETLRSRLASANENADPK